MERREALRQISLLSGAALSAPVLAAALGGCKGAVSNYTPVNLSETHFQAIATIADIIIPETDTPGAKEAGVAQFIDVAMGSYFERDDYDRFIGGMNVINQDSNERYQIPFAELDELRQTQIVTVMDQKAFDALEAGEKPQFFTTLKQLVLLGYYMSEVGATEELRYLRAPGRYEGSAEMGKTWA